MPASGLSFRLAFAAAAAVLVLLALRDFQAWRSDGERLTALLIESGGAARHPEIAARVAADPDSMRARVRVARALLADEMDLGRLAELSPEAAGEELRRGADRLDLAAELAGEVLESRPASWQAAFVLGAARYLALSRRRDPRLASTPELWEAPLETARRLAPGQPEPLRFLAAAYMSDWSRLSPERREQAQMRIGEALQDPRSFDHLIVDWLRVAGSFRRALALVPDRREAWETLQSIYRERGDLERYREVHERWFESLEGWLLGLEARARSSWRSLGGRRPLSLLHRALELPPDTRFAAALGRELERHRESGRRPPGRHVERWLSWALEVCLIGDCPLPPASLGRLLELAAEVPDHLAAHAALESGDLELAESYETRSSSPPTEDWTPYLIAKARRIGARGESDRALDSLSRIHPSARETAIYWTAFGEVAGDRSAAGVLSAAAEELESRRRKTWGQEHWTRSLGGPLPRLELLPAYPSTGLTLEFDPPKPGGRVLGIRLDGGTLGFVHVSGRQAVELQLAVSPDLHSLEVFPVLGGYLYPRQVTLRTTAPRS